MCLIGGTRLVVRASYQARLRSSTKNVLIYGAGESGRQLLTALHHGDQYRVVAFVDDDPRPALGDQWPAGGAPRTSSGW
jgi:FlaA1/EpsC-like NDP-sugar epimerase